MFRYTLAWGNPRVPCPGNRILVSIDTPGSGIPAGIMSLWKPGTGYAVFCQPLLPHRKERRWSLEAKARVRRANLRRRLERKMPLFAAALYEAEIAARPAYFQGQ